MIMVFNATVNSLSIHAYKLHININISYKITDHALKARVINTIKNSFKIKIVMKDSRKQNK